MTSWVNYIIESSLILALLLLFFQLVLSKEKCIRYNRYYLLISGATSIFIPLINLPITLIKHEVEVLDPFYEIPTIISQVSTFKEPQIQGFDSFLQFAAFAYIIGVALFASLFIIKLIRILNLVKRSDVYKSNTHYKIVLTHGQFPTFSFANYLFLNQINKSNEELQLIINHEEAHIKQKHSIDIILVEVYKIAFWFNPLSYQLAKVIRLNHEFLADHFALTSISKKTYIDTLLKQVYQYTINPMVHYFGLHSTEKRINMIRKNIHLTTLYKPYFSVPFFSILFFAFSCHFEPTVISPTTIGSTIAPIEFENILFEMRKNNPDRKYFFKLTSNLALEKIKAKDYAHYSIDYEAPLKGYKKESYGIIYSFSKYRKLPNEIFSTHIYQLHEVSEIPTPWGGYEALLENIDYHANQLVRAKEDKTIWVRFVITTIGNITYTNIIGDNYMKMTNKQAKEYGAAIKAINATSNQWRVGKIGNEVVNVEIELPVRFYKEK